MNSSIIFAPERSISCSSYAVPLGKLACCLTALIRIRCGQPKGEPSLADFKLHAALVWVCVGLTALAGVGCGIGGQPVIDVGVVGLHLDHAAMLVKIDYGCLLLLGQPCSHASSFLPSVAQEWHFSAVFSGS